MYHCATEVSYYKHTDDKDPCSVLQPGYDVICDRRMFCHNVLWLHCLRSLRSLYDRRADRPDNSGCGGLV